ncbi:MAG TPA: PilN domain-containing protein [Gammaproteobacteria bacterium]|nr:PilN domain-containing protein [Gammaproteobacteria bacterium]
MVQINMLPWRERARKIKQKNFFIALAISIGATLFIISLFHIYYADLIQYQDQRNLFLQTEISQRQSEINLIRKKKEQQDSIEVKLKFLMQLREKNYKTVKLLGELIKIVPDNVILKKITKEDNSITIDGIAQSELAIAGFLKVISQSVLFQQPVLTGISASDNTKVSTEKIFQVKMDQKE